MDTNSLLEKNRIINDCSTHICNDKYAINKYIHTQKNGQFIVDDDCGLIFNAHTHLCRANSKPITSDIESFLQLIMKYRSEITENETIAGVNKALTSMLGNGIQGYISHQNHRHIRSVIKSVRSFPLKHNFARMCTDNTNYPENIREKPFEAINETINLWKEFPDVGILYGPMGLVDCSLEMFEIYGSIIKTCPDIGLQTHIAEEYETATMIKEKYGKSEIELLFETNCLSGNTSLVHCTHVTDKDIEIILHTKSKVILCPRSSFNAKTFSKLIKKNVPLMLGTDAYEMYAENLNKDLEFIRMSR